MGPGNKCLKVATVNARVAETRAVKGLFNKPSEVPRKCLALEKLTRCRIKFSYYPYFSCIHTFPGTPPPAFWHFLSYSLDSNGPLPYPSSLSQGVEIFFPKSQKGKQGAWGICAHS